MEQKICAAGNNPGGGLKGPGDFIFLKTEACASHMPAYGLRDEAETEGDGNGVMAVMRTQLFLDAVHVPVDRMA